MKTIILLKCLRTKCNEINRDCDKCDKVTADLCNELCGVYNPHSIVGALNRIKKYEDKVSKLNGGIENE